MAKSKNIYVCSECGHSSSKWLGKCPNCGAWNSFVEEVRRNIKKHSGIQPSLSSITPVSITKVNYSENDRIFVNISEFDRVLGGIVPGQAVLVSGEPGIGKSTLLLQVANNLAATTKVLFVNGEESSSQVKSRASRLGMNNENLLLLADNQIENIIAHIEKSKPGVVFVDSVQTIYSSNFDSLPGGITQVREGTNLMVGICKRLGIPLFLVSHITKSGNIAGPKIVEHIVDTVLFLESDNRGFYRILRSLKNRFHQTDEIGFFKMGSAGMQGIADIGNAFVMEHETQISGIAIFPFLEGNRAFPVETQALCTATQFNFPRRTADGIELNRLLMLIAIMEKRLSINLAPYDIYVNITGGLKITDPALDLAVIFAIYSSLKNIPSPTDILAVGEVGLAGEVRLARGIEKRLSEMERLGFKSVVLPFKSKSIKSGKLKLLPIKNIKEGIALL